MNTMTIIKSQSGEQDGRLDISNIGIFYNKDNEKAYNAAEEVSNILNLRDIQCRVLDADQFMTNITFAVILGGDGAILKASRYYAPFDVPVFGINLGRLGFLSQAKLSDIREVFDYILNGQFRIENRMMLSAFDGRMTALNDIVVKSGEPARAARMYVSINGHKVCDYITDGIIISSPAGSSAYNLSAGGPILHPSLDVIAVTPICPHTMSARPVVIPSSEVITITSGQNISSLIVSADGQNTFDMPVSREVTIVKSKDSAKLLLLNNAKNSFYSVLKEKLHWGYSWQE